MYSLFVLALLYFVLPSSIRLQVTQFLWCNLKLPGEGAGRGSALPLQCLLLITFFSILGACLVTRSIFGKNFLSFGSSCRVGSSFVIQFLKLGFAGEYVMIRGAITFFFFLFEFENSKSFLSASNALLNSHLLT